MSASLPLSLFDFELPSELIAQQPVVPRHDSRLLLLNQEEDSTTAYRETKFLNIAESLKSGDLLVVNRTRVIPARLKGKRPSGGKVELLCLRPESGELTSARRWWVMGKPGKAMRDGNTVIIGDTKVTVLRRDGMAVLVESEKPLWPIMEQIGELPLPPYIERPLGTTSDDEEGYQTVFAQDLGAVAAPTAALHFTTEVLKRLKERGVEIAELVLHVGAGTFLPVREECAEDVRTHQMHAEWYTIPAETLKAIERRKGGGHGRIVAVGTTSARAIETWARCGEPTGESTLFIYPGKKFLVINGLLTNFHLPKSTLLMLVAAFIGHKRMMDAYAYAIEARYRFFSYGDAMLLL